MGANRAVIFANGALDDPAATAALLRADDWLIAADGGLRHLRAIDRAPHVLIGDLDSVSAEEVAWAEAHGTRVLRYPPEKDDTDLELALALARADGYKTVRIIGALGGRVDHMLGNLALLANPALEGLDARIIQPGTEVFLVRGQVEIEGGPGDLVSLLPVFGIAHGVTTTALQYPLRGESLLPYRTRGISNVMLEKRAGVSVSAGTLLCIHISRAGMEISPPAGADAVM